MSETDLVYEDILEDNAASMAILIRDLIPKRSEANIDWIIEKALAFIYADFSDGTTGKTELERDLIIAGLDDLAQASRDRKYDAKIYEI